MPFKRIATRAVASATSCPLGSRQIGPTLPLALPLVSSRRMTKTLVERAKAVGQRAEVADSVVTGLYLVVYPSGRKTWAVRARLRGRVVKITVGSALGLEVGEARERARDALRSIARGEDPRRARGTVGDVFEEWMRRDQAANRRAADVRRLFERDVLPRHRGDPIGDLDRRAVRELVERVVDRGSPVMARRLQSHLHRMFQWAAGVDLVESNPIAAMPKPGGETPRDRVLADGELAAVWRACDDLGWPFGQIVRLLILTGARRGEIAALRWSEIDGDVVRLGSDRTKNGRPHAIPLSAPARAILGEVPRRGARVFTTNGETAPSGFSRAKRRLDRLTAGEVAEPFTVHDLRRTVATGLQRLGHRLEVIEAVLGHVGGSRRGIVGVYQRHAFEDEKRKALEDWAAALRALECLTSSGSL